MSSAFEIALRMTTLIDLRTDQIVQLTDPLPKHRSRLRWLRGWQVAGVDFHNFLTPPSIGRLKNRADFYNDGGSFTPFGAFLHWQRR